MPYPCLIRRTPLDRRAADLRRTPTRTRSSRAHAIRPGAHRSRARRALGTAALLAAALSAAACEPTARALGASPAKARANADTLFTSLAARFGPSTRGPRYAEVTPAFLRSPLVPGALFRDDAIWSEVQGDTRLLDLTGEGTPGNYVLDATTGPSDDDVPTRPGEFRGQLRLTRVGGDVYEWDAHDVLAAGSTSGADLGRALDALFAGTERLGPDASPIALIRARLPHATAAIGRFYALDSIRITPNPRGGADVRVAFHPDYDSFAQAFPHAAMFARKFGGSSVWSLVLSDEQRRVWWALAKTEDQEYHLALRVHDGSLAPLEGPVARIPDHLVARFDGSTKAWIFRIGLQDLEADVTLTHMPGTASFTAVFQRAPGWQLPPLVEQMLRAPLTRPFQGRGSMLSFGIRSAPGAQSMLYREYSITVEESAIMRWFNGLGTSANNEFRGEAEHELGVFSQQAFQALAADLGALATSQEASSTR